MISDINAQEHFGKYNTAINTLRRVGRPKAGATASETVYSDGKVCLQHYMPNTKRKVKTPLLIIYALVNRHHIADLDEKRSMVRKLLDRGIDPYIIDWGYPDPADRYIGLDDYIHGYINDCVDYIHQAEKCEAVNLLGICQGGTFSCCYTALYPKKVKNLITMVAPFDFHVDGNTLGSMARNINVRQVFEAVGNIKGHWLNQSFSALNSVSLNLSKYINAVDSLQDDDSANFFLRMESWIQDSPDQAGEAICEFIEKFYHDNQLINGGLSIGGQKVDPACITQPVLNVYGLRDHIVPPKASSALKSLCSSQDYTELTPNTGHIGMYVSGKAQDIPVEIYDWLLARDR